MKVTICIGHSSKEQGSTTQDGKHSEYEFNSILAQAVVCGLKTRGYIVYLVNRLTDGGGTGMTADVKAVNKHDTDCIVELHANAFNSVVNGCETLYWHTSKKGKILAQSIQNEVVSVLKNNNRGIKPIKTGDRGAKVLKESYAPMVILEPFFIDNPDEYNNAVSKFDKLAESIVYGIKNYFKETQI